MYLGLHIRRRQGLQGGTKSSLRNISPEYYFLSLSIFTTRILYVHVAVYAEKKYLKGRIVLRMINKPLHQDIN